MSLIAYPIRIHQISIAYRTFLFFSKSRLFCRFTAVGWHIYYIHVLEAVVYFFSALVNPEKNLCIVIIFWGDQCWWRNIWIIFTFDPSVCSLMRHTLISRLNCCKLCAMNYKIAAAPIDPGSLSFQLLSFCECMRILHSTIGECSVDATAWQQRNLARLLWQITLIRVQYGIYMEMLNSHRYYNLLLIYYIFTFRAHVERLLLRNYYIFVWLSVLKMYKMKYVTKT